MYRALSAPITCQIELTSACNNDCIHCYNHWRHCDQKPNDYMTDEMIDRTVQEMAKNNVFQVTLTGGEVFLRRSSLFRMIEKLISADISCAVNSNLTIFTRDDAKRLRDLGIGGILTSVCSFESHRHDEISRRRGSFEKTMRGIALAIEGGLTVAVSMVVTKLNIHDIKKTGLFLKELGVRQFFATKASPPLNAKDFNRFMISKAELMKVLDDLVDLRENANLDVGILECYPLCGYQKQSLYSFATGRRCSAGITTCTVSATGGIRPCSHSDEEFGNIESEGLQTAWNNMTVCRDGSRLPDTCRSCKLLPRCSGGCRVDAFYCTGKYDEMDPYAAPEEIPLVKLSKLDLPKTQQGQSFVINKNLKVRREPFGVLIADRNYAGTPAFITHDTFKLIEHLHNKPFTVTDVMNIVGLPIDSVTTFCGAMLRDRIFLAIEPTREEKMVMDNTKKTVPLWVPTGGK